MSRKAQVRWALVTPHPCFSLWLRWDLFPTIQAWVMCSFIYFTQKSNLVISPSLSLLFFPSPVRPGRLPSWLRWQRICLQCRRPRLEPWVENIPWRREWLPTPVFLLGEFHGQRSLAGYSPWRRRESSDTTERLTLLLSTRPEALWGQTCFSSSAYHRPALTWACATEHRLNPDQDLRLPDTTFQQCFLLIASRWH